MAVYSEMSRRRLEYFKQGPFHEFMFTSRLKLTVYDDVTQIKIKIKSKSETFEQPNIHTYSTVQYSTVQYST